MTEYEAFARAEAARRGVDPDTSVIVWNSEGGLTEPARRGTFDTGSSWWAAQLHYGGQGYEQFGTVAGMGNSFTAKTGWAPGDPAAWRDAMRYALDHAKAYGWGAWYGARARGIVGFKGIDTNYSWGGTPDSEWDYKQRGGAMPADVTSILQRVIELGRAELGKPYSGPIVGQPDSYRWGDPGWDCSSFVSGMYSRATGGQIQLIGFTDAAWGQCEWMQAPQPGDIVFYSYPDSSQPGVKFPHMGIWLSASEVLDCRYNDDPSKGGVGIRPHVTPISSGNRFRQTMRPKGLAGVVVTPQEPPAAPSPVPVPDELAVLRAENERLRTVLGYATVDIGAALEKEAASIRAGLGALDSAIATLKGQR